MPLITNVGIIIEDGTPFEITYDGSGNIDYIDYTIGTRVFRENYTYVTGNLTEVSIPTEQ